MSKKPKGTSAPKPSGPLPTLPERRSKKGGDAARPTVSAAAPPEKTSEAVAPEPTLPEPVEPVAPVTEEQATAEAATAEAVGAGPQAAVDETVQSAPVQDIPTDSASPESPVFEAAPSADAASPPMPAQPEAAPERRPAPAPFVLDMAFAPPAAEDQPAAAPTSEAESLEVASPDHGSSEGTAPEPAPPAPAPPAPSVPTIDFNFPSWGYETAAVQTGIPRGLGQTIGLPIHAAAAFQFDTLEQAQREFQDNEGYSYARLQNPTVKALETRLNALEGGEATLALSSGQAATLTAVLSVCRAGDHVVASSSLFGGTAALLTNVLPLMGIQATLTDGHPEALRRAATPQTRLFWAEMISNPSGQVAEVAELAEAAHDCGALLAIDNTCGGAGFLCRPLAHGADIVVQSLTKWAGGHGSVMGGSVTVGRGADLSRNPIFTEGGAQSLLELRGEGALAWRQRWLGASQLGMTLAPHSAFLIAQGLETLALRLERESQTALALARWLSAQPEVGTVSYPGLDAHPSHAAAQRYLPRGQGAIMTFEVPDPASFFTRVRLIRIAPNLGDTRTLAVHPWTTTHAKIPEEARRAAGVTPRTIRLSVGVERLEDLQADIAAAL